MEKVREEKRFKCPRSGGKGREQLKSSGVRTTGGK